MNKKKADEFFQKEIDTAEVSQGSHYSYRDGFRLGLGIFVGFLAGSLVLVLVVYLLSWLLKAI